jgi:hypothetical protein
MIESDDGPHDAVIKRILAALEARRGKDRPEAPL